MSLCLINNNNKKSVRPMPVGNVSLSFPRKLSSLFFCTWKNYPLILTCTWTVHCSCIISIIILSIVCTSEQTNRKTATRSLNTCLNTLSWHAVAVRLVAWWGRPHYLCRVARRVQHYLGRVMVNQWVLLLLVCSDMFSIP